MTEPRAVIVGTGRSGSGYIAQVLTAAGVPCGHEGWWNPFDGHRAADLLADSSWCALAIGLDDFDGEVFHQLRHPLDVVSSMAKTPTDGPYRDLQTRLMPWVPIDPVEYGMLAWFFYVEAAQRRAVLSWRLEDVDVELVQTIAGRLGVEVSEAVAAAALDLVPRDYNRHGDGPRYDWVDLPAGGLRDQLMAWAKQWGWT